MAYQEIPIPVQGGTLMLCQTSADLVDELAPGVPPSGMTVSLKFEYMGYLPREMALELVRRTPEDQQVTVNGRPLLEFLESLGADQH